MSKTGRPNRRRGVLKTASRKWRTGEHPHWRHFEPDASFRPLQEYAEVVDFKDASDFTASTDM